MPRKVGDHAELEAIQERTRRALATLASGVHAPEYDARWLYDGLVETLVRVVYLFLAGRLSDPNATWDQVKDGLVGLDEELSPEDRWAKAFPFLSGAAIDDAVVRAVLGDLLCADRDSVDVEHLGTVYESTMGYAIEVAHEPCLGVLCRRKAGDSQVGTLVGLDSMLARLPSARRAALKRMGVDVQDRIGRAVEQALSIEDLARALKAKVSPLTPSILPEGTLALTHTTDRRRSGSHYTPRALADDMVADTLGPLVDALGPEPLPEAVLNLAVCDPAMGSGAFLLAACRFLGEHLLQSWAAHGVEGRPEDARRRVAEQCIYGVDKDASAVLVTKLSLRLLAPGAALDARIRQGDSLVDFDYAADFSEVFAPPRQGFDAFLGNPPWVSYAGRAAQPLAPHLHQYFAATYTSFAGYRNLQGLFIELSAMLLRPGGRLGFIVPSSMAEQDGYAPTRRAHDRWCICDPDLRDLGNESFSGVFQPCMALVSTRLPLQEPTASVWPIARTDLDAVGHALLEKMKVQSPLPPHLFGERGIQTSAGDAEQMRDKPDPRRTLALRIGGDIEPFVRRAPSLYCDPERLSGRVRDMEAWRNIRVLIRQTARVPMAALSDGLAFRNSILAGFADERYPAAFLAAYLNATPIRWLHYARHRDARQGMPQLKIGHLRATPAPPDDESGLALVAELSDLGERMAARNTGIEAEEQRQLDGAVAKAFGLSDCERALIDTWWAQLA